MNRFRGWQATAVAFFAALALVGCGGSDGAAGPQGQQGDPGAQGNPGPQGPPGPAGGNVFTVGSNALTNTSAIQANADAWAQLEPTVTVTKVTIASPPVVEFTVLDGFNRPVVGLGNTTKASGAALASYPNLAFSLAKLVPGTNGSPSKWVNYIVTSVSTSTGAVSLTRPSTDNIGTLVDNGDGTYKYTFYRDVPGIKAQVDGLTAPAGSNKADLGDLTYQPTLTHRLTIQLSGNAPGTGTNTDTGAASSIAAVPMRAPYDAIYDFIPATGQPVTASDFSRDIVANANCENCHRKLGGIPGLSAAEDAAGFHGGSRNHVRYCAVCHTEQRKYGQVEATVASTNGAIKTFSSAGTRVVDGRAIGNLPNYIHKVHMSKLLVNQNYDYAGVKLNEATYPQDIRNCQNCHDGAGSTYGNPALITQTKDGDHWRTNPSTLACGACHDGINYTTGAGVTLADALAGKTSTTIYGGLAHGGGPVPDDSQCTSCHNNTNWSGPGSPYVDVNHYPVTPPSADNALLVGGTNSNTNAGWIASGALANRLPEGAIKVSYDIQSVSAVADGGGVLRPRMVFQLRQNGVATKLNDVATAAINPATGQKEIWDGFMGAPSLYFVFAVPQDGNTAPADFNASVSSYLRCLWNGTAPIPEPGQCVSAGTLTYDQNTGYYTATLTGAIIPATAKMLTGGIGYSYNVRSTLPLTQTNLAAYPAAPSAVAVTGNTSTGLVSGMPNATGGLIVIAPNVKKVATGYTGRREIVDDTKCNACHQELGAFTEDAFHAGQRNDATSCSWCHTPNQNSSGWSADSTAFVHAIHASAKRFTPYNWHAASATENFSEVTYPGILNDCLTCHRPGTFDFTASDTQKAIGGTGTDGIDRRLYRTVGSTPRSAPASYSISPYVNQDSTLWTTLYGAGFSFNATTGATTEALGTTLVNSPTVTVCSACHDTPDAISHFQINGASFYQPRSAAITGTNETCLVCHGSGRLVDIAVMHSKNR